MADEPSFLDAADAWCKNALGVDPASAVQKLSDAYDSGKAALSDAYNKAKTEVVDDYNQAKNWVAKKEDEAIAAAKSLVSPSKPGGGAGPLGLSGSVGQGGKNNPDDVKIVQRALGIGDDGQCGGMTIKAIQNFQRTLGQAKPDGRIDPGGPTARALANGGGGAAPLPDLRANIFSRKDALPFPTDLIKDLKSADPSGIAAASVQIGVAVSNLTVLIADYQNEAMFEGGPNKHEWWNLWGIIGTSDQQKAAELLLENAAKATELVASLNELATGMTSITAQVQAWTSSLPDAPPAETPAGELAEKLENVGKVLAWVNAAVQGANTISQCMATSHKLAEFKKNPKSKTAEEWAQGVAKIFDGLGSTIGSIPGFPVAQYWSGLLKAPKAIIGAFIAAQHTYFAKIDEMTKDNGTGKGKVLKPGTSENDPDNQ